MLFHTHSQANHRKLRPKRRLQVETLEHRQMFASLSLSFSAQGPAVFSDVPEPIKLEAARGQSIMHRQATARAT